MRTFAPPPTQVPPLEEGANPQRFSPQWIKWFNDIANRDLYYGIFYSLEEHTLEVPGQEQAIAFELVQDHVQVAIPDKGTKIRFTASGLYQIVFSGRVTSIGGDLVLWLRKNGVDVPASGIRTALRGVSGEYVTLRAIHAINGGDYLEVIWLPENEFTTFTPVAAVPQTTPAVPSVRIEITQIELWDVYKRF